MAPNGGCLLCSLQPEQAMTPGRWRTADSPPGGFRTSSYTTGLTGGGIADPDAADTEATGVFRRSEGHVMHDPLISALHLIVLRRLAQPCLPPASRTHQRMMPPQRGQQLLDFCRLQVQCTGAAGAKLRNCAPQLPARTGDPVVLNLYSA